MILPRLVVRLLFGADLAGSGVITSRVAGLALLSLGCACWPENVALPDRRPDRRAVRALLIYNGLASVYFLYLRALAGYRGIALVPAIVVHAVLTVLLARESLWYRVAAR